MNTTAENDKNTLFRWADQLAPGLWDDVDARPAQEAAAAVGAQLQDGVFTVPMVGCPYLVDRGRRSIHWANDPGHRVSYQSGVVLLYALARSLGVPASGRMVTPLELPGGRLFFTGAHTLATRPLAERFGRSPELLLETARALGGEPVAGADCAVRIPGLPFVPLYVLLWAADAEFEARAVIGIDDRAHYHLDLGAVLALTNILVARMTG